MTDLALLLAEIDTRASTYKTGSTVGAIVREGVIAVAIGGLIRRFSLRRR